jgi:hypothetical protein
MGDDQPTPAASGPERVVDNTKPRGSRFRGDTVNTVMVIERNKNQNVVCYEAITDKKAALEKPKKALVGYWMDIDPEYVAKMRAKGVEDDRAELSMIECKFAYGYECGPLKKVNDIPEDLPGLSTEALSVSFVAISDRSMQLRWRNSDGAPVLVTVLRAEGKEPTICILERVWVQSTEPKHFYNMPTVEYVDLFGTTVEGDEKVTEHVVSKK